MKTKFFNLIILDESGSMCGVTAQTIAGCNETINTILTAQREHADTQVHFLSIYCFQEGGRPSRYLCKNEPVETVKHIGPNDYEPWGSTNLNDAVGMTLVDLKARAAKEEEAVGSVTIITDGMENASREYKLDQVRALIEELKGKGWNFNFIGANIDVETTAHSYAIDNHLSFCQSEEGTQAMFEREALSRANYYERVDEILSCCADTAQAFSMASKNFYQEEPVAPKPKKKAKDKKDSADDSNDKKAPADDSNDKKEGFFGKLLHGDK